MRQCALTPHFFKFAFCQICVAIFLSQSFQHTPLKILVNFESGVHVCSGVLCRNVWKSALHLFVIWFTDILANLDIQTELCEAAWPLGRELCQYVFTVSSTYASRSQTLTTIFARSIPIPLFLCASEGPSFM